MGRTIHRCDDMCGFPRSLKYGCTRIFVMTLRAGGAADPVRKSEWGGAGFYRRAIILSCKHRGSVQSREKSRSKRGCCSSAPRPQLLLAQTFKAKRLKEETTLPEGSAPRATARHPFAPAHQRMRLCCSSIKNKEKGSHTDREQLN